MESSQPQPLPLFRQDLEIYRGPDSVDGSPTYNLYDPVAARYFKISWEESLILQCLEPGMTSSILQQRMERSSSVSISEKEIGTFFEKAATHNLLQIPKTADELMEMREKQKIKPWKWMMSHYLYLRIPLFHPNDFLKNTLPYVLPFTTKFAMGIYIFLSLFGIFAVVQSWDEYVATFPFFFTPGGIATFILVIFCVKLIHEFSHAYTAKYYGIQVPTMGLAFLVFWPVFFTDVTHGWRLQSRKQRLAISGAGIAAELVVAGLSLFCWSIASPGIEKSVFFVLSSTSLFTSLLINMNPALRFDGYYLLSDLWGIDNLQFRAFAITRWKLYQWLVGADIPPPEENLSANRIRGMVIYSLFTWSYRVFLMTVISLFIYYTFTKALGIVMVMSTLFLFIVWPLWNETKLWGKIREKAHFTPLRWMGWGLFALFLLWIVLPWPHFLNFVGITVPVREQVVYVPHEGEIAAIYVQREESVEKGQPLLQLQSFSLNSQIAMSAIDKEIIDTQIAIFSLGREKESLSYLPSKISELARVEEELKGYQGVEKQLLLRAERDGILISWNDDLRQGQSLPKNAVIGKIAAIQQMEVHAYIPGKDIADVHEGQEITFFITSTLDRIKGRIRYLHPIANEILYDTQLSSLVGGPIPVQQQRDGTLLIMESYYLAVIDLEQPPRPLRFGEIGWVETRGPWRSYFLEGIQRLLALFWQQSSF